MKLHAPSIPLFTVDPYFSVWYNQDVLHTRTPVHWTGAANNMWGTVTVDGTEYRFLGRSLRPIPGDQGLTLEQTGMEIDACSTTVYYENAQIKLKAVFTSPMLVEDLYYASRPVTYVKLSYESADGKPHAVSAKLAVSEELVLNRAGDSRVWSEPVALANGDGVRMGNGKQNVLAHSGDNIRIDWGYFYLAAMGSAKTGNCVLGNLYCVYAETEMANDALFALAYDEIDSIIYFEKPLKAYWKKDGKTITEAIDEALSEYDTLLARCNAFSDAMRKTAIEKGNEKYADFVQLAYRQVMAAHKLVVDEEGNNLYISKECFSNGCAATVDVTYPSAPMYLYYNPELLKAMLRPVLRFSRSAEWTFDFAPHDVGQYPILNGQVYGKNKVNDYATYQMPVEECGNMIVLFAALGEIEKDYSFAAANMDLLEQWSRYLIRYGEDPDYQLCTDDFAGHLSHNCNLSLKAIMGIAGYAKILTALDRGAEADEMLQTAKKYADSFLARAANADGSYRLAYDRPETFSLKYNAIWDKLWNTNLFPESFYAGELARYRKEAQPYGVPLDSREMYTKSDWMHWVSCFGGKEDFCFFNDLLFKAYSTMRTSSRVPMTDWFYADTAVFRGFQHRTVQGGLFFRFLFA